jgi:hypothetical protein
VAALQPVQGSFPFSDDLKTGSFTDQRAARDLNLDQTHTVATGSGVTVGVIDGGVDYTFAGLADAAESGYDFVDDDFDAFDEPGGPNSGHGTFVAGVIHLVAPDAQIKMYRVSEVTGDSDGDRVARAIVRAVNDGCQVINLSLVVVEEHAVLKAALEYAWDRDVLVVAAAGNGSTFAPLYPASDPNVLCVAAVDSLKQLAEFSRYGSHVDLCAPGANVYSFYQNDLFAWWSGTSFAAPFVSGVAALVVSQNVGVFGSTQTRDIILQTAENIDAYNPGYSGLLGAGLINPMAAVNGAGGEDVADLRPNKLSLSFIEGSIIPHYASFALQSTNAPAAFAVSVYGDGVAVVENPSGTTDDSVYVIVNPEGLTAGAYSDTLEITVEGVSNNPLIGVVDVSVSPILPEPTDSLNILVDPMAHYYTWQLNTDPIIQDEFTVTSTGDPLTFTATLAEGARFTTIIEGSGTTDGTVTFQCDAGGLSVGLYEDTVVITAEGADNSPVSAPIFMNVVEPNPPPEDPWYSPRSRTFVTPRCEGPESFSGSIDITAPAGFTAAPYGDLQITLDKTSGTGTDVINYTVINPITPTSPSSVTGAVGLTFEGIETFAPITHDIAVVADTDYVDCGGGGGETPGGGEKTAAVSPDAFSFVRGEAELRTYGDCFTVFIEDGTSEEYSVELAAGSQFTTLQTGSGTTPDSVCFMVDGSNLPVGQYVDRILVTVANTVNSPVEVPIALEVVPAGEAPQYASVSSSVMSFWVDQGETADLEGYVLLSSTNAPAAYTGSLISNSGLGTITPTLSGVTDDSIPYSIPNPGERLSPGIYTDMIQFEVEGVVNSPVTHTIQVTVTSDTVSNGFWLNPVSNLYLIDRCNPAPTVEGTVLVGSGSEPISFTASVNGDLDITLLETSVITPAAIRFSIVNPIDQQSPSLVSGSIVFSAVDGSVDPVTHYISLVADTGGCGGGDPSNPGEGTAAVSPAEFNLSASERPTDSSYVWFSVTSTNAPAEFSIVSVGDVEVATPCHTSGITPDNVCAYIETPSVAGIYTDTLAVTVQEATNNPQYVVITMTVGASQDKTESAISELSNFPNPFNPTTEIFFTLTARSRVSLTVYNVLGQAVGTLIDGELPAGSHSVSWNANSNGIHSSSGVYFYRLVTDSDSRVGKMLLVK